MLAREKDRLETLRGIKAALMVALTEKGRDHGLTEEEELKVLQKLLKQRNEAAEIYRTGKRDELYQKEKAEAEVISGYLPQPLSTEALKKELEQIIAETGASSPADMGKVMGVASKKLAGKADGKTMAGMVRSLLGG